MSKPYPTPHIDASPEDFASTVLMPGDPLRAKYIAENFMVNAKLVNNVRGIMGYTGIYGGKPVSVMASGMGMPSMGIYSYELFCYFGVERILRVGSAGSYNKNVKVRDLIFAQGACTNSAYAAQYDLNGNFAPISDFETLETAVCIARDNHYSFHVGNVLSSDTFYTDEAEQVSRWQKMGVLGVEMEAAALYMNAARLGKKALAICTVSDSLITGEALTAAERQTSLNEMITLALDTATR